jgi:hypothetical protein
MKITAKTRPRYTLLAEGARSGASLAGAATVLAVGVAAWPYTVDDAFITARYARNLAAGLGYGMNAGQPSDGVTGPLWLLPQIAAYRLGVDAIACAKAIGLACSALAAWCALRKLRSRTGGRRAAGAGALLIALSPSLGTWAIAGLETGLATLLVTTAALAATRAARPAGIALGACVAALAWLRPEIALLGAVLIAYGALRDRRAGAAALALAVIGAGTVIAFRLALFDDPLPLSYRAKLGSLAHGARYTATAAVLATSLAGLGLALYGALRGRRDDRAIAIALLAHLLAVVLAGGDWMPGYRLLVPVLPLYAMLAAVGAARLSIRRPRLAVLGVALACALPALDLATRIGDLRASARNRARIAPLARLLASDARVVALVDVGYLGLSSGVEVVDLGGLTDPVIARMPGGHLEKRIDPEYLRARDPDVIVLHSASPPRIGNDGALRAFDGYPVERRLAAIPFVREHFRVHAVIDYAPGYHYLVLVRPARFRAGSGT